MKSNQKGFSVVVILLVVVILGVAGFAAWKVTKNDDSPPTITPSTTSNSGNDCGTNRQCFYQAFSTDCSQKTIKTTHTTIEGDPITTTAKIAQGFEGCIVEVTVDGSQDKFGDGKIHTYTCEKLAEENQMLTASECTGTTQTHSVLI